MRRISLIMMLAVAVAACGKTYDIDRPANEVLTTLASLPAETNAMTMATQFPGTSVYVEPSADKVTWHFLHQNREYGRYVATLSSDGPSATSVTGRYEAGENATLVFLGRIARLAGDATVEAVATNQPFDRAGLAAAYREELRKDPTAAQMAAIETISSEMSRMAPPRSN